MLTVAQIEARVDKFLTEGIQVELHPIAGHQWLSGYLVGCVESGVLPMGNRDLLQAKLDQGLFAVMKAKEAPPTALPEISK